MPCRHGVVDQAELEALGLDVTQVLDFSVNSNPLGPSPRVAEALAKVEVSRYPDSSALGLRRALSRSLGLPVECITVSNGSVELLWHLALVYLQQGDRVLVLGPTFGEYERVSRIFGAEVIRQVAKAEHDFRLNIENTLCLIKQHAPKLVFLCNPNNPTGLYLARKELERVLSCCTAGLLVLDEAYVGFVEEPFSIQDLIEGGNLLILRSMTKDYALAGLRLGYGLSCSSIISALEKVRPPWNVNALAQAAGVVALEDRVHLERSRRAVLEAKGYLVRELTQMDLKVFPSAANFLLVQVGDAAGFRNALLARGCAVRDCTSFGLPEFIRIGVRTLPECQRLIVTMKGVKGVGL